MASVALLAQQRYSKPLLPKRLHADLFSVQGVIFSLCGSSTVHAQILTYTIFHEAFISLNLVYWLS
jgi:hypothetical protein